MLSDHLPPPAARGGGWFQNRALEKARPTAEAWLKYEEELQAGRRVRSVGSEFSYSKETR
jgi:hypothetical protein